ncbi:MAG: agmatinase [Methanobacterium sp.]|nr:agmatinase [Methanobacterium sp.]
MFLYTEDPLKFAFSKDKIEYKDDPGYGILGVPFDGTATYQPGARYGPNSIREASYNLENFNLSQDRQLETPLYDLGNLEVINGNFQKTSLNLESTIREILDLEITPLILGGEHIISYSICKALNIQDTTVLHFDAHLDLRDDYQGEKYSHATVLRRIHDLNPSQIIPIGIRSGCEEEFEYTREAGINYYTASGVKENLKEIEKIISSLEGQIYVTVDMDVLDPAYAPSVGTPCPGGLDPHELQKLLYCLKDKDVVGFDLVEVSSRCMGDITSVNAAQVVYDFLCL